MDALKGLFSNAGLAVIADMAWPAAIALAWFAGELGHRWARLPRISVYAVAGFLLAQMQGGALLRGGADGDGITLLANVAFGLILFEQGYRVNLNWLRTNLWIGATSLLEAAATFAAVYWLALRFGMSDLTGLLMASLAMASSPASIMRVVNEQRSAGQVTERLVHLSALNCIFAVFAFKVIGGFWVYHSSGDMLQATWDGLAVLMVSAVLGALLGIAVPGLLRFLGNLNRDATVAFAISILFLVALTHALKLSPVLAALTFGFVARNRRVALSHAQGSFGALGDLLAVFLFVYASATLEWKHVQSGAVFALAFVALRLATKIGSVALLARASGITLRKGVLAGVGLAPMSVFVILLMEQARHQGVDLVGQLAPLAAATLLLEIVGPILTRQALRLAGENHEQTEA